MATVRRPTVKSLSDELGEMTAWTEKQVDRVYNETAHVSSNVDRVSADVYRLETYAVVFAVVLYYLGYVLFAQIFWG